jgi:hypothetical protein
MGRNLGRLQFAAAPAARPPTSEARSRGIQHRTTPVTIPARVIPSRACCTAHPRYGKTASLVFWSFPKTQGLPRPSGVGLSEDLGGLLSRKHRVGLPVWHRRERASPLLGAPLHASRADHPTVRPSDREIGVWGREATFSAFEFFASSKFHPAFVSLESLKGRKHGRKHRTFIIRAYPCH